MSVIEAKRKDSAVKFIMTAMKLAEHTFKYTKKQFNKSDKDIIRRVRDLSMEILIEVEKGNSIFPKSQVDVEQRYIHFINAISSCEAMCSLLCVIKYSVQNTVSTFGWEQWGLLLGDEISLVKGVISSDKKLIF